jgi:hypothetical protein
MRQGTKKLENIYLRSAITVGGFVVAFFLGYAISAQTGVEPGYFGAVETGSYGATAPADKIEGISVEEEDYYRSLLDE